MPLTVPETHSQTITTLTSVQYVTSSYVTTWYSTIQTTNTSVRPVRYDWTPYGYNDQTGSFSLNQFKETNIYREPGPCVYYDYFLLNATVGHEIRGHMEAYTRPPYAVTEAPVHFYILRLDQLRRFNLSYCGWYDHWSWEVSAYASSYDLDWVVQQNGEYALLFLAPNLPYYGTISFTANDYVRTVQSSPVTYTTTSICTLQSIRVAVSTQPNVNPQPSTSQYLVVLIAAIIILGLIILRQRMKRQRQ
jgi:hypothetical protein